MINDLFKKFHTIHLHNVSSFSGRQFLSARIFLDAFKMWISLKGYSDKCKGRSDSEICFAFMRFCGGTIFECNHKDFMEDFIDKIKFPFVLKNDMTSDKEEAYSNKKLNEKFNNIEKEINELNLKVNSLEASRDSIKTVMSKDFETDGFKYEPKKDDSPLIKTLKTIMSDIEKDRMVGLDEYDDFMLIGFKDDPKWHKFIHFASESFDITDMISSLEAVKNKILGN